MADGPASIGRCHWSLRAQAHGWKTVLSAQMFFFTSQNLSETYLQTYHSETIKYSDLQNIQTFISWHFMAFHGPSLEKNLTATQTHSNRLRSDAALCDATVNACEASSEAVAAQGALGAFDMRGLLQQMKKARIGRWSSAVFWKGNMGSMTMVKWNSV